MSTLVVDCANGVGAPKLREMTKFISEDVLSVQVVNDDITSLGQLNKNVSSFLQGIINNTSNEGL